MENLEKYQKKSNMQKVALTALAGTSIEWYDFFLYGAAAALISVSYTHLTLPTNREV